MTATPDFDALVAADEDGTFAAFCDYMTPGYEDQVTRVGDLLTCEPSLPNFVLTASTDDADFTVIYEVGIRLPNGLHLTQWVDDKHSTTDRAATGKAQAYAIRDALVPLYDQCASRARQA